MPTRTTAGVLAETVLLGDVAHKASGKIQYNAEMRHVAGGNNATRYLRRKSARRGGRELPL